MDEEIRQKILTLLDQHRIMTVATLRPDGWPQATTVGYASEGLTLYFLCGRDSQKAANLARDDRVSLTIDHDTSNIMAITSLSIAGHTQAVTDLAEAGRVMQMLVRKYPEPVAFRTDAGPGGRSHLPRDADRHLGARLLQGLRTHRSGQHSRRPGRGSGYRRGSRSGVVSSQRSTRVDTNHVAIDRGPS
jgi:nitroimidazol reductase NimA-like FMN-containing flavoprotein (pyridoxamine 5'-phosphate oxidase superfamily)